MRELVAHLVLATFAFQLSVPPAQLALDAPLRSRASILPEDAPRPTQATVPSGRSAPEPKDYGRADLRQWSGDAGSWSVSASGRTAGARPFAGPSLLIGPHDHVAFTLTASLAIPVGTGAGAAGFAFGRHAPSAGVAGDPSLVLTWTAAPAGAEIRGEWKLSRFDPPEGAETVHAQVGGSSNAYDLSVPRSIEIDSSPTHFRLFVAGEDVIDVAGSFPSGPVALYAERAPARFSDVEVQPLRGRMSPVPPAVSLLDEDDPAVGATVTKPLLWPANHGYVTPTLKVYATDPSGATPTVTVKVYSDEPDDQDPADGNLWPDVLLAQSPPTFRLRAERRSDGNGRVYLVQAIAQGPNGSAFDCLSVVVPLTNVAPDTDIVAAQAAAAVSYCDANGAAPAGFTQVAEGAYVLTALDQRVKPIVECVVPMGGNQYLAVFGYQNDNPLPATIAIGDDNKFTPLPIDRGQPIRFTPGHSPLTEGAFAFPFAGSSQSWSLRGPDGTLRTANASSNSTHCAFTPAVPVAVDDTATTSVDTAVAIPVLVNDSDPQSQPLSVARVTAPAHGTAVIETDGTVTYTPAAGYTGTDSFRYVVSDGAYGSDVATVTVTISGASNQAPVVDAGADQVITLPAATEAPRRS